MSSKASAAAAARRAQNDSEAGKRSRECASVILSGVEVPDPVFFCTIEPPSMSKQAGQLFEAIMCKVFSCASPTVLTHLLIFFFFTMKDLENVLNCLQREDPSLKVRVDPDSGQVMHRISRDFLCPVLE